MGTFSGNLRPNEIFASLFNLIISIQTFANPHAGGYGELLADFKTDGSMYGDTKLYVSTDILKTHEWGADAEATNLLALDRPPAPKVQSIILDKFRQIRLTTDDYLSKRAWGDQGAFAQFNSVIKTWVRTTKKIFDELTVNVFTGTAEASSAAMSVTVTLPYDANVETKNRLAGQTIAQSMADIFDEVRDISTDFNDNGFTRSYDPADLIVLWNTKAHNKVLKIDLPSLFHDDVFKKVSERNLPQRYFGTINTSSGTTDAANLTADEPVRSLIETDYEVLNAAADPRAVLVGAKYLVHVRAGDILPNSVAYAADVTYTQDNTILYKILTKKSIAYMSAFETGTEFFNPRSLTKNDYLTFGYANPEYLKEFPLITVRYEEEEPPEDDGGGGGEE